MSRHRRARDPVVRNRRADRDAGAATVWVACLLVLVVAATLLAVGGASAVTTRHSAQLAADLAALAGAERIGVGGDACAAAARVAAANGSVLRACEVAGTGASTGEVRVEVGRHAAWAGLDLDATARARAARVAAAPAVATQASVRRTVPCGSMIPARWAGDGRIVRARCPVVGAAP